MKNTEGVPRGRGLAAPESEYPMVLLCVSVCKHSNYWMIMEALDFLLFIMSNVLASPFPAKNASRTF